MTSTTAIQIAIYIAIGFALSRVEPQQVKHALASDWGPAFHGLAQRIGAFAAFVYTCYVIANEAWQRVQAWASRHQLQGLARMGLPGAPCLAPVTIPVVIEPIRVRRQAPQPVATIAAPDLSTLTVAQLRVMARAAGHKGIARSGRRAQLLEVLG